jgi:proline racemase
LLQPIHTINQTLFAGPIEQRGDELVSKNAVVVSPGRLDRCPCGTGSSARMALLHATGQLAVGQTFRHQSIIDSEFLCRIENTTMAGQTSAVIPNVSGRAWLTGISYYGIDPEDPYPEGYRLNDTWFAT